MIFVDRHDAGKQLAAALSKYKNAKDTIILGLPRGGVVTAFEVASALHLLLDITCPRKVGAPFNEEYAIGAITETGQGIFNYPVIRQLGVSEEYLKEESQHQAQIAHQRLTQYRKNLPPRVIKNKTVILIDDGLATGATMKAAIQSVKHEGAKSVVVAIPVAPRDTIEEMSLLVDELVCLSTPSMFAAIGQFYRDFSQTEDQEVLNLLNKRTGENEKDTY